MTDDGNRTSYRKWVGGGAAVALLLLFIGVRGCSRDDTVTLTGKVAAKDGRPVTWGTVSVVAADDKLYSAPIRPDGTYQIVGLPPGPVRLAVTSPDPQHYLGRPATSDGDAAGDAGTAAGGDAGAGGSGGGGKRTVRVNGGSGSGGGTDGGWGSVTVGGGSGGSGGSSGNRGDKKQAFSEAPTVPPPQVNAPTNAPARRQWFPIPGRYANPNTSGFSSRVGPRGGAFDITVD